MLTEATAIKRARIERGSDEVEFDDSPEVSLAEDHSGAWVQAWVWIDANTGAPCERCKHECPEDAPCDKCGSAPIEPGDRLCRDCVLTDWSER